MSTDRLNVNIWKKKYHIKFNHKKVDVVILTQEKIAFKIRTIPRDKEEHLKIIFLKSIHWKDNPTYMCT